MAIDLEDMPGPGTHAEAAESLASLARGVLQDAQKLIAQQIALLKRELELELRRALRAAIALGVGIGLAAVGAFFLLHMVVYALAHYNVLPLWGSYGAVGGVLAVVGAGCLMYGGRKIASLRFVAPPQTTEALKENIEWMKHPTTAK